MGKSSPKDKSTVTPKKKRRSKTLKNRYLKPGPLSELRDSRLTQRSCTDIGKKRVSIMGSPKIENPLVLGSCNPLFLRKSRARHTLNSRKIQKSPATPKKPKVDNSLLLSSTDKLLLRESISTHHTLNLLKLPKSPTTPKTPKVDNSFVHGSSDPMFLQKSTSHHTFNILKLPKSPRTPKTPHICYSESESRLESLPLDLLVKILCQLQHDQLRAVFHVSQRVRTAVLLARKLHFNYITPARSRIAVLRMKTPPAPVPKERLIFMSVGDGNGKWVSRPYTPKTPLPDLFCSNGLSVPGTSQVCEFTHGFHV